MDSFERERVFSDAIRFASLELHVNLFARLLPHVKQHFFNREKFLQSLEENEKLFYSEVSCRKMHVAFLHYMYCVLSLLWIV